MIKDNVIKSTLWHTAASSRSPRASSRLMYAAMSNSFFFRFRMCSGTGTVISTPFFGRIGSFISSSEVKFACSSTPSPCANNLEMLSKEGISSSLFGFLTVSKTSADFLFFSLPFFGTSFFFVLVDEDSFQTSLILLRLPARANNFWLPSSNPSSSRLNDSCLRKMLMFCLDCIFSC